MLATDVYVQILGFHLFTYEHNYNIFNEQIFYVIGGGYVRVFRRLVPHFIIIIQIGNPGNMAININLNVHI